MTITEKCIKSILDTIKEFNWKVVKLEIKSDDCIWGLVEKESGSKWEGLYAPSDSKTELQDVFNKLKDELKI